MPVGAAYDPLGPFATDSFSSLFSRLAETVIVRCGRVVATPETPVGVEPTSTGLQPVAWPSGSSVVVRWKDAVDAIDVLARNRTWSTTFAGSRAVPAHSEDVNGTTQSSPARESDPALRLRRPPCARHTRGDSRRAPGRDERPGGMPSPGVEPGLRPSEGRVRFRHTPRAGVKRWHQQGRKDSNPVREFWRLAALPGAHPYRIPSKAGGTGLRADRLRRRDAHNGSDGPAAEST
jgi:hypothetical protein